MAFREDVFLNILKQPLTWLAILLAGLLIKLRWKIWVADPTIEKVTAQRKDKEEERKAKYKFARIVQRVVTDIRRYPPPHDNFYKQQVSILRNSSRKNIHQKIDTATNNLISYLEECIDNGNQIQIEEVKKIFSPARRLHKKYLKYGENGQKYDLFTD